MIHLVERAPPPPSQPGSGSGVTSTDSGPTSSSQGTSQVPPHDRNANSYVMLGTFNLPVNIMDPQQIQVFLLCDLFREQTGAVMLHCVGREYGIKKSNHNIGLQCGISGQYLSFSLIVIVYFHHLLYNSNILHKNYYVRFLPWISDF